MNKLNPLKELVTKQKANKHVGIYSACSANEYVIKAVLKRGKSDNSCVLIEATANQCDQNGGYTGMKPIDFKNFVFKIAKEVGFDTNKLFLGGDHLGPLTWSKLNEKEAMINSKELIRAYVLAGFTKIHIDTSMRVGDDDTEISLSTSIIAKRGAILAKVAEDAYQELLKKDKNAIRPVYIVGSEVPIPGGAQEAEDKVQVTSVADLKATIDTFKEAFEALGLNSTWDDVIGIVVQPGVEYGDAEIIEYDAKAAKALTSALKEYPNLIFEGHSTDYQTKDELKAMVKDGIAILKVGPALTFAMREGLFNLCHIEEALYYGTDVPTSHFIDVLEESMLAKPNNWNKHYHGDDNKLRIARKYSFSDRARYYMPDPSVGSSIELLMKNLRSAPIPLTLLSQYMPIAYTKVREKQLTLDPEELLIDRIINCIDEYLYASNQSNLL
ncbi:MAG: class II D-tagatose-bisphosphate aldolase, non-catalytic subunit [Erysipelotrichaceae bacterium]